MALVFADGVENRLSNSPNRRLNGNRGSRTAFAGRGSRLIVIEQWFTLSVPAMDPPFIKCPKMRCWQALKRWLSLLIFLPSPGGIWPRKKVSSFETGVEKKKQCEWPCWGIGWNIIWKQIRENGWGWCGFNECQSRSLSAPLSALFRIDYGLTMQRIILSWIQTSKWKGIHFSWKI